MNRKPIIRNVLEDINTVVCIFQDNLEYALYEKDSICVIHERCEEVLMPVFDIISEVTNKVLNAHTEEYKNRH